MNDVLSTVLGNPMYAGAAVIVALLVLLGIVLLIGSGSRRQRAIARSAAVTIAAELAAGPRGGVGEGARAAWNSRGVIGAPPKT
jgi:hypothetical protein